MTIQRESTKEVLNSSRDINDGAYTAVVVGRGEKSLLCDPGSELRLRGGSATRRTKIMNWDEQKK